MVFEELEEVEDEDAGIALVPRNRPIYRDRFDPLNPRGFSDNHILYKYRVSRAKIAEMASIYEHSGYCMTNNREYGGRGGASTAVQQMCLALRYFGHGGAALQTSDALHFSKATGKRAIVAVRHCSDN